jgi:hypothetical protein
MKNLFFLLASFLMMVVLINCTSDKSSITQEDQADNLVSGAVPVTCSGALGDVKYSILTLDTFIKENGNCWILMDSITQAEAQNYTLFNRYKIDLIPDARGVFIRGMNLGRDEKTGNSSGNLPVGEYKEDTFKNHNHRLFVTAASAGGPGPFWYGTNFAHMPAFQGDDRPETARHLSNTAIESNGEAETSPRNISLYTYIRVN